MASTSFDVSHNIHNEGVARSLHSAAGMRMAQTKGCATRPLSPLVRSLSSSRKTIMPLQKVHEEEDLKETPARKTRRKNRNLGKLRERIAALQKKIMMDEMISSGSKNSSRDFSMEDDELWEEDSLKLYKDKMESKRSKSSSLSHKNLESRTPLKTKMMPTMKPPRATAKAA